MQKKVIILLGTPGAGKGTQAKMIKDKIGLKTISVGNLLRKEIDRKTKIGKLIESKMSHGHLVDSKIVQKIIKKRIQEKDFQKGFILDGYPRLLEQTDFLFKEVLNEKKDNFSVIFIGLTNKEIKVRLSGRRNCSCGKKYHLKYSPPKIKDICDACGAKLLKREDDNPIAIKNRIKQFHNENKPIINFFEEKNVLNKINGEQKIEKIHNDIMKILKKGKIV